MDTELNAELRNKLVAAKTALQKLAKGEEVPQEFLELAFRDLDAAVELLNDK
nr:hypothetical protein 4 [bacterium]